MKARPERVHQHLEGLVVLDQVEDTEHTEDPQREHNLEDEALVEVAGLVQLRVLEDDLHVERDQRQQVDDVHDVPDEFELPRRDDEPEDELEGEEDGADEVQDVEGVVRLERDVDCFVVVAVAAGGVGDVGLGGPQVGERLETKACDGGRDKQEGRDAVQL